MMTYVALLRGINVAGRKMIPMEALQAGCEDLGWTKVQTYLQSGNVVFDAEGEAALLAKSLKSRIVHDFGHDVEVLVLQAKDLNRIIKACPFKQRAVGDESHFHCTFLFGMISAERFQKLTLPIQPGEEATLVKGAVMLHCPDGYGQTKLNTEYFEKALGIASTNRNWKTVLALAELCASR
jgi:uncharacterized protein (DUF1697 family)